VLVRNLRCWKAIGLRTDIIVLVRNPSAWYGRYSVGMQSVWLYGSYSVGTQTVWLLRNLYYWYAIGPVGMDVKVLVCNPSGWYGI